MEAMTMEKEMALVLLEQGVSNLAASMQGGSPRDYAKVLARGILGMAVGYQEAGYIDQAGIRAYRKRIADLTVGLWS